MTNTSDACESCLAAVLSPVILSCNSLNMLIICLHSALANRSRARWREVGRLLQCTQLPFCLLLTWLSCHVQAPFVGHSAVVRPWKSVVPAVDLSQDERSIAEDIRNACIKFGFFTSKLSERLACCLPLVACLWRKYKAWVPSSWYLVCILLVRLFKRKRIKP